MYFLKNRRIYKLLTARMLCPIFLNINIRSRKITTPLWLFIIFWLGKEESEWRASGEDLVLNFEVLNKIPHLFTLQLSVNTFYLSITHHYFYVMIIGHSVNNFVAYLLCTMRYSACWGCCSEKMPTFLPYIVVEETQNVQLSEIYSRLMEYIKIQQRRRIGYARNGGYDFKKWPEKASWKSCLWSRDLKLGRDRV